MQGSAIKKVGLVGCGIMGAPIAGHIMDAGYEMAVYTRTRSKAEGLLERGAVWADSPAELAKDCDVVFTMVGWPTDVEEVYLASDGLLSTARPGTYLIDLTTSSPSLAREIHEAAEVSGVHAFDCPVTGGQGGAIAGTLTLIVGADEADIAPVRELLESFSARIYCFGQAGSGQTAKLCNQVSLAGSMLGMAEAIAIAEQGGIDAAKMRDLALSGMGSSRAMDELGAKALDGDWAPGFLNEHFLKDLGLALAQAEDCEMALPGAECAFNLYDMICRTGGAQLGSQAIVLCYRDEAESVAAGLDWSALDGEDEDCGCDHDHDHDGCCHGHGHGHDGCCHHHDHDADRG